MTHEEHEEAEALMDRCEYVAVACMTTAVDGLDRLGVTGRQREQALAHYAKMIEASIKRELGIAVTILH